MSDRTSTRSPGQAEPGAPVSARHRCEQQESRPQAATIPDNAVDVRTDRRDEGNGPPEPGCDQSLRVKKRFVGRSRRWHVKDPLSRDVGGLNEWRTTASIIWAGFASVGGLLAFGWAVTHKAPSIDPWVLLACFSVGYLAVFAAASWIETVYAQVAWLLQLTDRVKRRLKGEKQSTDADVARCLWAHRAYLIETRSLHRADRGTIWISLATIGAPVVINVFKLNNEFNVSKLSPGEFAVAFVIGLTFVALWVSTGVRRYAQRWMASDFWEGVWWHLPLDP